MIVFLFAPSDDSLFISFSADDDSLLFFSAMRLVFGHLLQAIVISGAPVSTLPPLVVYGSFELAQFPCCMFVIFTPAEDYLLV